MHIRISVYIYIYNIYAAAWDADARLVLDDPRAAADALAGAKSAAGASIGMQRGTSAPAINQAAAAAGRFPEDGVEGCAAYINAWAALNDRFLEDAAVGSAAHINAWAAVKGEFLRLGVVGSAAHTTAVAAAAGRTLEDGVVGCASLVNLKASLAGRFAQDGVKGCCSLINHDASRDGSFAEKGVGAPHSNYKAAVEGSFTSNGFGAAGVVARASELGLVGPRQGGATNTSLVLWGEHAEVDSGTLWATITRKGVPHVTLHSLRAQPGKPGLAFRVSPNKEIHMRPFSNLRGYVAPFHGEPRAGQPH